MAKKRPKNHLKVPKKGLKIDKITKIPLKSPENAQKTLKTCQNGQKRPENHLIVLEKGLKLIKMTQIPLKSPENDQKTLKIL